jgi:hypothetical protein
MEVRMKKLVVVLTIGVLAGSVFAMSKAPEKAPADAKAVKDAACCSTDGSCCKTDAQKDCPACKAAGGTCAACKAKVDATKTVKEAGCAGGVCPLTK